MNMKIQRIIRLSLSYVGLALASIVVIYPILWIIGSSLNPGDSLSNSSMFPKHATLAHYKELLDLKNSYYVRWYWNTLKISIITMVLSVAMVGLMGYSYSRYQFVGRKNSLMLFLILQMVPQFSALIAIYVLAYLSGLLDTHLALILIYVGGLLPMNTWLAKGYFDTIPKELDESARMDGAGHFRIFYQIILPLAKPILAVIALFSFITPFTDFILATILLRSEEKYTLAVGLYRMISGQLGNSFTGFAAGAVLIAIPISLLFLSLQKYFVSGLTAGGTKG
ncbi:sugar ABC transporter permease [Priestia megaterium]|uniref:sugar ABC transporter permease n=1 Tax=Priestia megaterium TaxID=1404 RepID=UPI00094CDED6|nr:sugar ABC transporter permease [Priestia megaterium]OLO26581.1 sugar ABC transporter permease [Priestia megaterium]